MFLIWGFKRIQVELVHEHWGFSDENIRHFIDFHHATAILNFLKFLTLLHTYFGDISCTYTYDMLATGFAFVIAWCFCFDFTWCLLAFKPTWQNTKQATMHTNMACIFAKKMKWGRNGKQFSFYMVFVYCEIYDIWNSFND